MTILVTGANGQLGNEMRLIAEGSADKYIFTDITEQEGVETTFLDITNLNKIEQVACYANNRIDPTAFTEVVE